jgi:hypothetical protein
MRNYAVAVLVAIGCSQGATAEWVVSAKGIGPIEAGMTKHDVEAKLGSALAGAPDSTWMSCGYVKGNALPAGVTLMVENGAIARIDIDSGTVATTEGARIGDTEDRLKTLYRDLDVMPHKYTNGHYLTVRSAADSSYRIIFETDGQRVIRYRAGRVPQVEYVERCG